MAEGFCGFRDLGLRVEGLWGLGSRVRSWGVGWEVEVVRRKRTDLLQCSLREEGGRDDQRSVGPLTYPEP